MGDEDQRLEQILAEQKVPILDQVVEAQYAQMPELAVRYGQAGRVRCREDAAYHLSYLTQAVAVQSPPLFADYVAWTRVVLEARGIPVSDLAVNLTILQETVVQHLPADLRRLLAPYFDAGVEQLCVDSPPAASFVENADGLSLLAQQYMNALLRLERRTAETLISDAVEKGVAIKQIYLEVFQPVQYEIGRLWQRNQITVAQEHYCTAATQLIMSRLYPYIFTVEKAKGTMVAACVGSELHEIGVRMVADFFEMDGWNTIYLGANTPIRDILHTVQTQKAELLCLSATMTYHVKQVQEIVQAVRSQPSLQGVKVLVGGYPFQISPELWKQVGADGCGVDAEAAVKLATKLIRREEL